MRSVRRTGRYLEATRVFGAVTAGRVTRNIEALAREAEEAGGRLPGLAGRAVSRGVQASGAMLRGSGQALRGLAERVESARHR